MTRNRFENSTLDTAIQLKIDILLERGDLSDARALARDYGIVQKGKDYCSEARQHGSTQSAEKTLTAYRLAALGQPERAECLWWYGQWLTDDGFMHLARVMVAEGTRLAGSPETRASGERYLRIRLSGGREIPKRVEQLTMIGHQLYVRDNDLPRAIRALEEAIRLEPHVSRPYLYRAQVAWGEDDRSGALRWLETALERDPESWRTHRVLGRYLEKVERYAEAETHLRKAAELFGEDVGGRLALARVLYAQRKFDEYARETEQALQIGAGLVAEHSRKDLDQVRTFLATFKSRGPSHNDLPPAPDPKIPIGWNYD